MTLRRVGALWAIQSCVIGWHHGADMRSLLLGTGVLLLQAYAGIVAWGQCRGRDRRISAETVGVGIVAAVSMQAASAIAWGLRIPLTSLVLPLVIIVILGARGGVHALPTKLDRTDSLVVVTTAAIGMLPWSSSLAGIIVPAWSLAWLLRRHLEPLIAGVGFTVVGVVLRALVVGRTGDWLDGMVSNDTLQDEALSRGVISWGLGENMGLSGHPTRYHVLSHAWAGQISADFDLPGFVAHLILQPPLAYTAIGCLVVTLARKLGAGPVGVLATLIVVFAQASATETLFPIEFIKSSMTLGTAAALTLLVLIDWAHAKPLGARLATVALAATAATATKFHFAAIVAMGSVAGAVRLHERKATDRFAPSIAATVGVGIGWIVFFRGTGGTDDALALSAVVRWTSVATLAGAIALIVARIPAGPQRSPVTESSRTLESTAIVSLGVYAVLTIASSGEAAGRNYALTFAFVAAAPLVGQAVEQGWSQLGARQRRIAVGIGLMTGCAVGVGFELLKWRIYASGPRVVIRALATDQLASSLIVILAATVVGLLIAARDRAPGAAPLATTLVLVAASTSVFGIKVLRQTINEIAYGDIPVEAEEAGYRSRDFEALVAWITDGTSTSAIIATTSPCMARTTMGARCTSEVCADWRIGSMPIAGLTGRRVWLEAPSYMSDTSDVVLLGGAIERRYLVLRDARKGDSERALAELRRDGVDYLVVDTRYPLARTPASAEIVYRNAAYEVIRL